MEQPESANPTAQKGSKRRAKYIRGGLRTELSHSWFISERKRSLSNQLLIIIIGTNQREQGENEIPCGKMDRGC
jgi:hypothetical protein